MERPASDSQSGALGGGDVAAWTPLSLTRDAKSTITMVDERGGKIVMSRRAEVSQAMWRVWRYVADSSGTLPPDANVVQVFSLDADGTVRLNGQTNRDENVEVEFEPGLIVINGQARVGEAWEQSLRMVVHPLGDRSRVRTQGPANLTGVIEAVEAAGEGGGVVVRVRSVLEADLSAARVVNESTQWYQSGVGLVREVERERTKVLGITVRDNAHQWRAVE